MTARVPVSPPALIVGLSLFLGGGASLLSGCGDLRDSPCGLVCPNTGILQGNATISGVSSIDSFFGAVIDFSVAADRVTAEVQAELDGIAISVGLPPGSTGAEVRAGIEAKITEAVDPGGLQVKYAPATCKTSLEVTAAAVAECDTEIDAGAVELQCEGSCDGDAEAQAEFRAWVNTFRVQLGALVATSAKVKILGELVVSLGGAAEGAVKGAAEEIMANGKLKDVIGAGCGLLQLGDVGALVELSGDKLSASTADSIEVFAAIGG